jgi:hypothetical protein
LKPHPHTGSVFVGAAIPAQGDSWFVPAGLLDDDPNVRPDKHIYVEFKAPWDTIADLLPQMTKPQVRAHRVRVLETGA